MPSILFAIDNLRQGNGFFAVTRQPTLLIAMMCFVLTTLKKILLYPVFLCLSGNKIFPIFAK